MKTRTDSTNEEKQIYPNELFFKEIQLLLNQNKEVWIRVKGGSMRPFIADGDRVLLQRFHGQKIPLGAVLLGKHNDNYVLHRFVRKNNSSYILAGDDNLKMHESITSSQLIAIATKQKPQNQSNEIALEHIQQRLLGLIWYRLRFLRRVWAKLKKRR